jgi:hypothetical protein
MVSMRATGVSAYALILTSVSIQAWGQAAPATTDSGPAPAAQTSGQTTAQTPAPSSTSTPAPAAAPAPAPTWSIGPIDFSGLIDGYYGWNFNNPSTRTNQLYNFDVQSQQFSLNMAKLTLSHAPDPMGFEVDFGFGKAFDMIHAGESEPQVFQYLEQAYVSFKPPKAKGLEIDFGEFVTSAGAEVIESNNDWNYSRSLLFSWAIPYYHFGLRTSFPVGKHFTGGVQVVNGWNNIEDNNTGKTLGLNGTITYAKWNWANTWYVGPEHNNTNKGWRNLADTVLNLTPPGKANAYLNYDYGHDKNIGPGAMVWWGIAGALHIQTTSKIAFTPRVEYYNDHDGFTTGVPQHIKEFTMTGEYKWMEGVLSRFEYRRDWSDVPFFQSGATPNNAKNQDTVTLALVGFFGPKR